MNPRPPDGRFPKGVSGNRAGRPAGSRNQATLMIEQLLEGDAEPVGRKLTELAKKGNIAALRLCIERLAPVRRERSCALELPTVQTMQAVRVGLPRQADRRPDAAARHELPAAAHGLGNNGEAVGKSPILVDGRLVPACPAGGTAARSFTATKMRSHVADCSQSPEASAGGCSCWGSWLAATRTPLPFCSGWIGQVNVTRTAPKNGE